MLSLKNLSNPTATISKLLKSSSINVDFNIINSELERHPDYPSLLSISDILSALKIENRAFRANFEELADINCPFIAHTNLNGGEFLVVTQIKDGNFIVANQRWNKHKISHEEFNRIYKGVALIVEPAASSSSPSIRSLLINLKTPIVTFGLALILSLSLFFHTNYFSDLSWQLILLTLLKSSGLIISVLLLIQSIDANNPLVQAVCQRGGKTDCNAILSTSAAKVFDGLSWSEVGFFYFAGTLLLLLFGGKSPPIWQTLALLNFFSLPYTVYSIFYQARIAKKWCLLCCSIQILLWFEFILILLKGVVFVVQGWDMASISTLLICLLTPVILWILLKPLFLKAQRLQPLKEQLREFKFNGDLFNIQLKRQPKYAQPNEEWSIVLGNRKSENIITMVTNPYCGPCSAAHKSLDELIRQNKNFQARILFLTQNTEGDPGTQISQHLMALNELEDETKTTAALRDWYEQNQKNYAAWSKAYPVALNGIEHSKVNNQRDWCQMAEIVATPTLLLNGYKLPRLYNLPDLKYMFQ